MLKRFCRNHVLFVVVCLITLELPITSVCQLEVGVEESTVKGYLERGKRYIEMELYDQAITEFHQILQINLNHSETYYCLGNAYRYQNMIDKAVDAYQRVLALKASKKIHGLTYLHLGILYNEQGKFSDAEKYCKIAVEMLPKMAKAYTNLGDIYLQRRNFNLAISCYQKAIGLDPDAVEPYTGLGRIYLKQNQLNLAIKYCKDAIQRDTFTSGNYYNLAQAYRRSHKLEEAKGQIELFSRVKAYEEQVYSYREALQFSPNNQHLYLKLAEIYENAGDTEAAIHAYQASITLNPEFQIGYQRLGNIYMQQDKLDLAKSHLLKAIQIGPTLSSLYKDLGEISIIQRDFDNAIMAYQKLVEFHPDSVKEWLRLGVIYINAEQFDNAFDAFQHAVDLDTNSARAHNHLARLCAGLGIKLNYAIELAEKATILDPTAQHFDTLAYAYYKSKFYQKAESTIRKALKIAPDNQHYRDQLVEIQKAMDSSEK